LRLTALDRRRRSSVGGFLRSGVEERLQVFVSQAIDRELAAADDFQQASVLIL
jgi:hypothetical protein